MTNVLEKVGREMATLTSYIVEADVALTKAVDHVTKRVPHSPLVEHLTKLCDMTHLIVEKMSTTSTALLGPTPTQG